MASRAQLFSLVFLMFLILGLGGVGHGVSYPWLTETVDRDFDPGYYSSLQLDRSGKAHIAYHEYLHSRLVYASQAPDGWKIQAVDSVGHSGRYVSLALDSNDNPRIAYWDGFSGTEEWILKYTWWDGTRWLGATVTSAPDPPWNSLVLDQFDNSFISYFDPATSSLRLASFSNGVWTSETVDGGTSPPLSSSLGQYNSLALDSAGRPAISYYDSRNGNLKYAYKNSSWEVQTIDSAGDVGTWTSLAVDSKDRPHICYKSETTHHLRYASYNGTVWSISTVDEGGNLGNVGRYCSLQLDQFDRARVAYQDQTNFPIYTLKYAEWNSTVWNISVVGPDGDWASLKLDDNDNPHLSCRALSGVQGVLEYTSSAPAPQSAPSPPRNLVASTTNSQVSLSWLAPENDGGMLITRYEIFRGVLAGGEFQIATSTGLSYIDTSIVYGVTYYYKVRAINAIGAGPVSETVSITAGTTGGLSSASAPPWEKYWYGIVAGLLASLAVSIVIRKLFRQVCKQRESNRPAQRN